MCQRLRQRLVVWRYSQTSSPSYFTCASFCCSISPGQCKPSTLTYSFSRAAVNKGHKLGDFNVLHILPPSSGGQKSEIKVSPTLWVLAKGLLQAGLPLALGAARLWQHNSSLHMMFFLCAYLCPDLPFVRTSVIID